MVHGYVRVGSEAALEAAHARVREATGIRLWNSLRGSGYGAPSDAAGGAGCREMYFEQNMGPANMALPIEEYML